MAGKVGMRWGIRKRENNITNGRIKKTKYIGDTKECSVCKEFKEFEEFTKSNVTKSGLAALCKMCNHLHVIKWKQKQSPDEEKIRHGIISAKWYEELKLRVINHYGGPCYCCGEDRLAFLTLDHIDGGGLKHRKEINVVGSRFYKWLENNNYPEEIRLRSACANCNMATRHNKVCPHRVENET